ncbi:MAG: hypothetical protein WD314_10740 [Trueperaceae bacterium]
MKRDDTELLVQAQALVHEKYAGIELESAIQGWAYLGEFDIGIQVYQSLTLPTAKDDRWLGVCLFQRFEDMLAQEAFFRALSKGEEAARVNLAHLLRFLERSEEAVAELVRVDVNKLSPYDKVLYLRVSSLHEETNGNIRKAVEFAERAWSQVQGIPEFQLLAPSVLGQLGILYGRMGEARRALWFLEHGIELTTGLEQQKVKLRRATLLINLGRASDAEAELSSLGGLPQALELERDFLFGELRWSMGRLTEASSRFSSVVETASKLSTGADEFSARVALVAICSHTSQFQEARENLQKARILISDRTDVLVHRFREILLHVRSEQYGLIEAASELEMLAVEFRRLGTLQEEASVRVHLAETYRLAGDGRLRSELAAVRNICSFVHNSLFLAREWFLLPELSTIAADAEPLLFSEPQGQLRVVTIGSEMLLLNGHPVKPPLRRTVEMLSYFIEFQQVTLSRLTEDLFPSKKARTARSYFHQFRVQLRRHVSGVEIAFDNRRNIYELRSDIEILWDVDAIRRGDIPAVSGHFLPSADAAWVKRLDSEVQSLLRQQLIPSA